MFARRRPPLAAAKSCSESRKDDHQRHLDWLENLTLSDTCCDICHCDCYNSHRESDQLGVSGDAGADVRRNPKEKKQKLQISDNILQADNNNNSTRNSKNILRKTNKVKSYKEKKNPTATNCRASLPSVGIKRSKSACSIQNQSGDCSHNLSFTRDCTILKEPLSSFDDLPKVSGASLSPELASSKSRVQEQKDSVECGLSPPPPWPSIAECSASTGNVSVASPPVELCDSMANLCLSPAVRQAFQKVPTHDKKIINRMARSRSEKIAANENAWLARKYWENERYERELLKCEQMDEYKKAVKDKQFQDYLTTKARLNEIAHRDLKELQSLRDSLRQKDERTKLRLDAIHVERGLQQCQRRCDELRRSEAVSLVQEERHLDEALRKRDICHHLEERLKRADVIRNHLLDSYLKRLRYGNYIEQLLHEENWREAQQFETMKRDELKERISRKKNRSERFVQRKRTHNVEIRQKAKISASLRDLVRSSVTPDGAGGAALPSMGRIIFERPFSNLSLH